jgi:hypothetical protein
MFLREGHNSRTLFKRAHYATSDSKSTVTCQYKYETRRVNSLVMEANAVPELWNFILYQNGWSSEKTSLFKYDLYERTNGENFV